MSMRPLAARLNAVSRRLAGAALIGSLLVGATLLNAPLSAAQAGDTDRDGLIDNLELEVFHTDPNNPDTDGDGHDDYRELLTNTDQLNPDTDGDGLGDGREILAGLDPLTPNGGAPAPAPAEPAPSERPDSDGDGLFDDDESGVYGSDPGAYDSDGDGVGDGEEVFLGTDPLG